MCDIPPSKCKLVLVGMNCFAFVQDLELDSVLLHSVCYRWLWNQSNLILLDEVAELCSSKYKSQTYCTIAFSGYQF